MANCGEAKPLIRGALRGGGNLTSDNVGMTAGDPRLGPPTVGAATAGATAPSRPATPMVEPSHSGVSVRGTAIVAVGMTVAQVLALSQMLIVSRVLGPTEFGIFGSLAVFLLLGSTAQVATQVVVARQEALRRPGEATSAVPGRVVLLAATITTVSTAAISPLLATLLGFDTVLALLAVSATFLPLTLIGAQLGYLQGREMYNKLGMLYVLATAGRVFATVAAAVIWDTAFAATLGLFVGTTAAWLIGDLLIRSQVRATHAHVIDLQQSLTPSKYPAAAGRLLVEIGHAGHALIALYALTNVDVLIARSQLTPHDAGLYAAGQLVARAVFFLPQAILVAAFPRMVVQGGGRAQKQATAAVALLGLLATLATAAFPDLTLSIVAGQQYVEVTDSLWIFALAGAGFGVVQVLLYARLAQHDRRATVAIWTATLGLTGLGVTVGQHSVAALATCAAAVAWSVAVVGLILDGHNRSKVLPGNGAQSVGSNNRDALGF